MLIFSSILYPTIVVGRSIYIIDFPFFPKWRKSGIHWILSSTFGAELHIWPFLSKFDYFFQTVSKTLGRAHLTENFVKTLWKTFKTTRTSPSPLTKKSVCSKWRKHQVSDLNWIWVQEMILLLNSLTIRTSLWFWKIFSWSSQKILNWVLTFDFLLFSAWKTESKWFQKSVTRLHNKIPLRIYYFSGIFSYYFSILLIRWK